MSQSPAESVHEHAVNAVPTLADRMARYATGLEFSSLPHKVVHEVKRVVIDSLGVALAAWDEEPCRILRGCATRYSAAAGGGATVLGTRHLAPPDWAALANGVCVRYFDYNDTYLSKEPAHPSDNITAALAVAEMAGRSGRDLITAIVLAYEVQCRLCDAASIRARGWDHPTYGSFSTCLAACKLLGLDETQTRHALGIGGTGGIQMRQTRAGELSHWKGVAFAHAARQGVYAAVLAADGLTGPAPVFEGVMGFEKQVSGPLDDLEGPFSVAMSPPRDEQDYMIRRSFIKNWPAEYHSQSAIAAALEIRNVLGGDVSSVESVVCRTHKAAFEIIGSEPEKWRPEARETADHSLPYIVAAALVDGDITAAQFAPSRFTDPQLLTFVDKVKIVEDAEMTALYPDHIANVVIVRTRDGRDFMERCDDAPGHVHNRLTDDGLMAKYRKLATPVLGRSRADEVADWVWALDRHDDLKPLLDKLVITKSA